MRLSGSWEKHKGVSITLVMCKAHTLSQFKTNKEKKLVCVSRNQGYSFRSFRVCQKECFVQPS